MRPLSVRRCSRGRACSTPRLRAGHRCLTRSGTPLSMASVLRRGASHNRDGGPSLGDPHMPPALCTTSTTSSATSRGVRQPRDASGRNAEGLGCRYVVVGMGEHLRRDRPKLHEVVPIGGPESPFSPAVKWLSAAFDTESLTRPGKTERPAIDDVDNLSATASRRPGDVLPAQLSRGKVVNLSDFAQVLVGRVSEGRASQRGHRSPKRRPDQPRPQLN